MFLYPRLTPTTSQAQPTRATRWRRYVTNSLFVGATLSVLLHAAIAVAVVTVFGGIFSSGRPGAVYMVSVEPASSGTGGQGRPAFSWSRSFPPAFSKQPALPTVSLQTIKKYERRALNQPVVSTSAQARGSLTLNSTKVAKDQAPAIGGDGPSRLTGMRDGAMRSGRALVASPAPPYPEQARRAGFEGRVLLQLLVASDGTPLEVSIERSSGRQDFDQSARDTVLRQWRFAPSAGAPDHHRLWIRFTLQ
ncbi:MAG: energy transducer TonB [Proteobacteria bacterium]|nr:energy transducer TonB [Pseudomonadota bacterium]